MENNAILIGSILMALTSTLSLAGVLVRTGKLVEKVERLEEIHESLKHDFRTATEHMAELSATVRVLEARIQYQQLALQQAHVTPELKQ